MEIDPFSRNNPEASPGKDDEEDSSSKKKKKSKRAAPQDSGDKKTADSAESTEEKKTDKTAEPLWRRILGQPEEEKETPPAETDAETEDTTAEEYTEDTELETLSDEERLAVAQAYIDAREAELLQEQAEAAESGDEETVAERTADISLLQNMRQFLQRDRGAEEPFETPVNEAYDTTVHQLELGGEPEQTSPAETEPQESEVLPLPPLVSLRAEQAEPPVIPTGRVNPTVARTTSSETRTFRDETYQSDFDNRRRTGSALLVGGLVGYAIGRRRGRIKTEKRLKVVEQKLTKQVEAVQQLVVQKEQQIRSLARETYTAKIPSEVRPLNEKVTSNTEKKLPVPTELLGSVTLKAVEAPRRETAPTVAKPEAKLSSPGGHMAMAEKSKPIAALSRTELLVAAAEVRVGATNLRKVYETNLISEQGLRRLLAENDRGGNVREMLEREIVEKEMSYERDPRIRNSGVMGALAAGKVVRADIDKPTPAVQTTRDDSKQTANGSAASNASTKTPASSQKAAAAAVVTLLVVIAVLLVILFSSR